MGQNISGVWGLLGRKKMVLEMEAGKSAVHETVRWLEKPKCCLGEEKGGG